MTKSHTLNAAELCASIKSITISMGAVAMMKKKKKRNRRSMFLSAETISYD